MALGDKEYSQGGARRGWVALSPAPWARRLLRRREALPARLEAPEERRRVPEQRQGEAPWSRKGEGAGLVA